MRVYAEPDTEESKLGFSPVLREKMGGNLGRG